jgi:hypothetical protein
MKFSFDIWKALWYYIKSLLFLFLILAVLFAVYRFDIKSNLTIILGVIIAFELPITCLFLQYLRMDYGASFYFDRGQNVIEYKKGSESKSYTVGELVRVNCLVSPTYKKKGDLKLYPQDDYFHYNFHFINGDTITITSLLIQGRLINEANFRDIDFVKKTAFIPFI